MTRWPFYVLLTTLSLGCSAGAQKPAIATALDDRELRQEAFEATLRVTDENPEYVDDLFQATLRHPATLDRFMRNTAKELERDEFARFTAKRLVADPEGLKRVFIAVLDDASDEPAALKGISEVMEERPQLAAIVVVQSDASLRRTLHALVAEVQKNPEARRSFVMGLNENSDVLAQIITSNPQLMATLLKSFVRAGVGKGKAELEALAKALD